MRSHSLSDIDGKSPVRRLANRAHIDLAFDEAVAATSGNPVIALTFGAIRTQVHALMLRSLSDQAMRHHSELSLSLQGDDLALSVAAVQEGRGLLALDAALLVDGASHP